MSERFIYTTPDDPLARPLIEELAYEYDSRYGDLVRAANEQPEMSKYPADVFAPPHGNFLLLIRNGQTVGGGAFKRYDSTTAEFKRVWTRSDLRRQGIARKVLLELEAQAVRQGYERVYLTTGFRQPEAVGLYENNGYESLPPVETAGRAVRTFQFAKQLAPAPVWQRPQTGGAPRPHPTTQEIHP
jgi:GNAT superfamily N-acetyltransferase